MFLRDRFTKCELYSLLGKLLYISRCIFGSHWFFNRLLQTLRDSHNNNKIYPDDGFQKDHLCTIQFLSTFNGVVSFRRNPIHHHVCVDATLKGIIGVWGDWVYAARIPETLQGVYSITHYEMYNIMVAIKVWAHLWQDKVVLVSCDNQSVVNVCQTGKTKDQFWNMCLHSLVTGSTVLH